MTKWLDPETRALLERSPPDKLAPPDTATFALVLLAVRGRDWTGLSRAIQRIRETSEEEAQRSVGRPMPRVLKTGLSYEDALFGQFELISCDAVSVFLADDVVREAVPGYLSNLFGILRKSDEFEPVSVRIEYLPESEKGEEFRNRFLGGRRCQLPAETKFMRKKARIMQHWAAKIGGRVVIHTGEATPNSNIGENER